METDVGPALWGDVASEVPAGRWGALGCHGRATPPPPGRPVVICGVQWPRWRLSGQSRLGSSPLGRKAALVSRPQRPSSPGTCAAGRDRRPLCQPRAVLPARPCAPRPGSAPWPRTRRRGPDSGGPCAVPGPRRPDKCVRGYFITTLGDHVGWAAVSVLAALGLPTATQAERGPRAPARLLQPWCHTDPSSRP